VRLPLGLMATRSRPSAARGMLIHTLAVVGFRSNGKGQGVTPWELLGSSEAGCDSPSASVARDCS